MKATQNIRIFESNVRTITNMYITFQSNWDVLRWKTVLKHHIMANIEKTSSAVRGYHHYRNTWFPQDPEVLDCYYEFENTFDMFAVKTCKSNGQIVGHLPREILRVTKFLLDRGAVVHATLSTKHSRRSPLVQVGLEIAYKVFAKMFGTIKNHLMDRYFELVRSLYTEPKNEVILGSFFRPVDVPCTPKSNARKKKSKDSCTCKKNRSQIVIYKPCFNT